MSVVVLEKLSPGGQMAQTSQIDNYPGFSKGVDGYELAEDMEKAALQFGAESELAEVLSVDLKADPKVIETDAGTYYGKTVVIATGAGPRELGVPGERELTGRGVHYCAHCDGMFYKGKTVVVAGGGNSAAADALLLSRLCEKVIVIHRRDTLRATKIYHKPLMEAENVEFRWNSTISKVLEDGKVSGVLIRDNVTGEESVVEAQGIFVSIGRKPASALVAGQVDLDAGGYIVADESTRTSIPGVFAVGDVRTKALRQIVTAVADGAVAAHYADEFLAEK
jgi:thioredoxin reductase (NADPH)